MLRYIYGNVLQNFPQLQHTMFIDRRKQFVDRLGWDLEVNALGYEIDQYDPLYPVYLIWEKPDGTHGGSMRLMPTTGRTMVKEHFQNLLGNVVIENPLIWECTRFCIADKSPAVVAPALFLGCMEMALRVGLKQAIGVFDMRMLRIYKRLGFEPTLLGTTGNGRHDIGVGIWATNTETKQILLEKTGICETQLSNWFNKSFGIDPQDLAA